jgi:hypothetical protein
MENKKINNKELLIRIDERVCKMHDWQKDQEGRIRGLEKARSVGLGVVVAFGAIKAWLVTQVFGN